MKKALKWASLVPICLFAWLATSALMAQVQRRAKAPVADSKPVQGVKTEVSTTVVSTTVVNKAEDASRRGGLEAALLAKNPPTFPDHLEALGQLKTYDVHVVDGTAVVNAKVFLADKQSGAAFIWKLSLLDANYKTLDQRVYDQQIFGMAQGGVMEPTFDEVVNLVPGTAMVRLSLYNYVPGTNTALFNDDDKAKGYLLLNPMQSVVNK